MPTFRERPVLQGDHALLPQEKTRIDWEGAHLFLEIVRRKSFRATADYLGVSFNAVRRRFGEFERSLGVTLITRHVDGIRLTEEGEKILAAVNQMEQAAFSLIQAKEGTDRSVAGEVRLAVTEGLGTFWIAPRLVEFQRANPQLLLDVHCAMRSADVLRLEADISVQLTRPVAKDVRIMKLGTLHLIPFAAQSYIDIYGAPKDLADYARHRVVIQADEQPLWQHLYDRVFPGVRPEGFVSLRTNVSSAHYWSIAKGAGIGMLPTYATAICAPIVPLDLGIHIPMEIWMAFHEGAARIPRVRRLVDWLVEAFSPKKFPWFRDEYIPPSELQDAYKGEPLVNMFAGFVDASRATAEK